MNNSRKIAPIGSLPSLNLNQRTFDMKNLNLDNVDGQLNQSHFKLETRGITQPYLENNFKLIQNKSLFQTADYNNVEVAIQTEKKESYRQEKIQRVKISIFIFVLVMIVSLALPIPFLFYFIKVPMNVTNIIIFTFSCAAIIVALINILCIIGFRNVKLFCQYLFMLDDIMLTILGAISSIVGILYLFKDFMTQTQLILAWISSSASIISMFAIAINFRIMVRFCQFNCCQVVIFKLVLVFDSMTYIIIGCYIYVSDYSPTGGYDSTQDSRILNFILLYIFSLVGLYVQMYSKVSDFDGTGDLLPRYRFEDNNDLESGSLKSDQEQYQQNTKNNSNNFDQ